MALTEWRPAQSHIWSTLNIGAATRRENPSRRKNLFNGPYVPLGCWSYSQPANSVDPPIAAAQRNFTKNKT